MLSFQAMNQPAVTGEIDAVIGFALGRESYVLRLAGGTTDIARGDPTGSDVILRGAPPAIAAAVYGGVPLAELERQGGLEIEGDRALAERFVTLFPLPAKAPKP